MTAVVACRGTISRRTGRPATWWPTSLLVEERNVVRRGGRRRAQQLRSSWRNETSFGAGVRDGRSKFVPRGGTATTRRRRQGCPEGGIVARRETTRRAARLRPVCLAHGNRSVDRAEEATRAVADLG